MNINKEALKQSLTNFYFEYGDVRENLDIIIDAIAGGAEVIENEIEYARRSSILPYMETYQCVDSVHMSVKDAFYDYREVLDDHYVVSKLGFAGYEIQQRISKWENEVSTEDKISVLEHLGKFSQLSTYNDIVQKSGIIVYAELFNDENRQLARNVDYALYKNRLFLLRERKALSASSPDFVMRNIFVDNNMTYELWGKILNLEYNDVLTRREYNLFIAAAAYALMKGPTVESLENAFKALFGEVPVQIVDIANADETLRTHWEDTSASPYYTPFEFMIRLPFNFSTDTSKLSAYRGLIDKVKPSYTDYKIVLFQVVTETLLASVTGSHKTSSAIDGGVSAIDNVSIEFDNLATNEAVMEQGTLITLVFDGDNVFYDAGLVYDEPSQFVAISGNPAYGALCSANVKLNAEKTPASFVANRSGDTVNISFSNNATNIMQYEIYRNDDIIGTISDIVFGQGNTISFSDSVSGLPAGTYAYYAISVNFYGPVRMESSASAISEINIA
jgi:hypothetical protein